jgi:hypothetical protein
MDQTRKLDPIPSEPEISPKIEPLRTLPIPSELNLSELFEKLGASRTGPLRKKAEK